MEERTLPSMFRCLRYLSFISVFYIKELDTDRADPRVFTSWPLRVAATSNLLLTFVKLLSQDADG